MSDNMNTPASPEAVTTGSPVIEQPFSPHRQKQMDAVVEFFRFPRDIPFYGEVTRADVIYDGMGVFVIGVTTSKRYLAVKLKDHLHSSEGDMADFAALATLHALARRVYKSYRIRLDTPLRDRAWIMVGDRVPGLTLETVWKTISSKEMPCFKKEITAQLTIQMARMRALRQPFIGRVGHNQRGPPQETRNVYSGPAGEYFGPFTGLNPEAEFDEWALSRLFIPKDQAKWRKKLDKDRKTRSASPASFVLTHGDLRRENIMVAQDPSGNYVITGIIDWELSGFLPEYAEYAWLENISDHDKEWKQILRDVVPRGRCSGDRLEFTRLLERACNPFCKRPVGTGT